MFLRNRYVLVVAAATLWSFIGLHTKIIQYNRWSMTSGRAGFYALLLIAFITNHLQRAQKLSWQRAASQTLRNIFLPVYSQRWIHWLGATSLAANMVLFTWGFVLSAALNISILNSGALLLITILSGWVLKEAILHREKAIIAIGCLGLVLVAVAGFNAKQYRGTFLGIGCAATTTISLLCTKLRTKGIRGTEGTECWALAGIMVSIFCAPWFWSAGLPSLQDTALIAVLTILHTALPDILYLRALTGGDGVEGLPLVQAVLISRLNPILSGLWTWYFLNEVPALLAILGSAIVIFAIAAQYLSKPKQIQA